jgi:2-haloacid dehalogenase
MARAYRHLLFDADGTLYDFAAAELAAIRETWDAHGIAYNDDTVSKYHSCNSAMWDLFEKGQATIEELQRARFANFLPLINSSLDPTEVNRSLVRFLATHGDLYPGALEVLRELKRRNYDICVCTNGIHEVQMSRLGRPETASLYRAIFTPYLAGCGKPRKEFFDYVLQTIGVADRAESIIIGDSLTSDIQGGINAGIDTVWFNPHKQKGREAITPTYEISDLSELLNLFPPI